MKRALALFAFLFAVAAGWSVYWFHLEDEVERALGTRLLTLDAAGLDVDAAYEITGYPFRFVIELRELRVRSENGWSWSTPALEIFAQPWNLSHVVLRFDEEHRMVLPGGDGGRAVLDIATGTARASLIWRDGRLERAALDANAVRAERRGAGTVARAERLQTHYRRAPDGAISLSADGLEPPGSPAGNALGPIEHVALDLAPTADWTATDLRRFDLTWGETVIEGSGVVILGLNKGFTGHLEARSKGLRRLIDAAEAGGRIDEDQAHIAKLMYGLSRREAGANTLSETNFSIEDGVLYLGTAPILDVPGLFTF